MKRKNKKVSIINSQLKAFTLLEMLVALVISGIVFSIAGLCYNILLGNYMRFKSVSEKITAVSQLREVIAHDVFSCSKMLASSDGFSVSGCLSSPVVDYKLSPEYVVRSLPNRTDTFRITLLEKKILFMGNEFRVSGNLLNECVLVFDLLGEKSEMKFYKNYGSDILIQEETNGH